MSALVLDEIQQLLRNQPHPARDIPGSEGKGSGLPSGAKRRREDDDDSFHYRAHPARVREES